MSSLKITKIEYHRVNSYFNYDIPIEDIIEEFGSMEKFEDNYYDETEEFWDFMMNYDYEREDDFWTDRKGGYEVEWKMEDED
jgi:hypothetical protein